MFDRALTFNMSINSYKSMSFIITNCSGFQDTNVNFSFEYYECTSLWQSVYNMYIKSIRDNSKFFAFKADGLYPSISVPHRFTRFTLLSRDDRSKIQSLMFLHKIIRNQIDAP